MKKHMTLARRLGVLALATLAACGGGGDGGTRPDAVDPVSVAAVAPPGSVWDRANQAYHEGMYLLQTDGSSYAYRQKFSIATRDMSTAPVRVEATNASTRFALPAGLDAEQSGFSYLVDGIIRRSVYTNAAMDSTGKPALGASRLRVDAQQLAIDYLDRAGGSAMLSYRIEDIRFEPLTGPLAGEPGRRAPGAWAFASGHAAFDRNAVYAGGAGYYALTLRPQRDGLRLHPCGATTQECGAHASLEAAFPLDFRYAPNAEAVRWSWADGRVETVLGKRMWIGRGKVPPFDQEQAFGVFEDGGKIWIGLLYRPTDAPIAIEFLNAAAMQSFSAAIR